MNEFFVSELYLTEQWMHWGGVPTLILEQRKVQQYVASLSNDPFASFLKHCSLIICQSQHYNWDAGAPSFYLLLLLLSPSQSLLSIIFFLSIGAKGFKNEKTPMCLINWKFLPPYHVNAFSFPWWKRTIGKVEVTKYTVR